MRYRKRLDSISFGKKLLRKVGVLVSPGDFFGAPRAFRLCFTCDKTSLKQGLSLLASYMLNATN